MNTNTGEITKRTRVELGLLLMVASALLGAAVAFGIRLGNATEVEHNQVKLVQRVEKLEGSNVQLQVSLASINAQLTEVKSGQQNTQALLEKLIIEVHNVKK